MVNAVTITKYTVNLALISILKKREENYMYLEMTQKGSDLEK